MIEFSEAYQIIMDNVRRFPDESISLSSSLGRILAEDVISDVDMPSHDKSAMDGFACRKVDLDKPLKVVEVIPAGSMPRKRVGECECSRIMTGSVVPEGVDIVVMVEHTREDDKYVYIEKKTGKDNIRKKSEDIKIGDKVLSAGKLITPIEIAVLAGAGADPVNVVKKPRVGVVATGSELVEPGLIPDRAQIRNSNSYQLCSQVEKMGCTPIYFGIAKDTPEATEQLLLKAFSEADVILFSGGVSMGDFDYVPDILKKCDADIKFSKVRVKPGKPTVFATRKDKYFFGLPGNPVSTFVLFEVLVKPFLYKLMDSHYNPVSLKLKLKRDLKRKKSDRIEYRPVKILNSGEIDIFEYHGSAHIHAYTQANGLIAVEAGVEKIDAGEKVEVIIL